MGRKKKVKTGIDTSVPDCLKPLSDCKQVSLYLITRCEEGTSDKIYVFLDVTVKKSRYLVRVWGAYGGTLSAMHTLYDQTEFQKLINDKGEKGYKIVPGAAIIDGEDTWGVYAEQIEDYISNLSTFPMGTKHTL
jgi:hypothetical protein